MKIVVETNFNVGGSILERDVGLQVDLKSERATIRTLLEELSRKQYEGRIVFIDPETSEVDPTDYSVMVNGAAWEFLPQRLETELIEGDKVSITRWLEILGGG